MDERTTIDDDMWGRLVKNMLRAEMTRRGVSYDQLVKRLAAIGITETVLNLRNKVSRGRFTAPFFMQCMIALGVDVLQVPRMGDINSSADAKNGTLANKAKML